MGTSSPFLGYPGRDASGVEERRGGVETDEVGLSESRAQEWYQGHDGRGTGYDEGDDLP